MIVLIGLTVVTQFFNYQLYPRIGNYKEIEELTNQTISQYGELTMKNFSQSLSLLPESELRRLSPLFFNFVLRSCIALFEINLIITCCLSSLVYNLAHNQFSWRNFLIHFLKLIPQNMIFMLLIIPILMVVFIILSLIPQLTAVLLLLATIIYMSLYIICIALSMEPKYQFKIRQILKYAYFMIKNKTILLGKIIIIWLCGGILLKFTFNLLPNNIIFNFLLILSNLLLTLITICYIYRLYLLTNKVLPYDSCN